MLPKISFLNNTFRFLLVTDEGFIFLNFGDGLDSEDDTRKKNTEEQNNKRGPSNKTRNLLRSKLWNPGIIREQILSTTSFLSRNVQIRLLNTF